MIIHTGITGQDGSDLTHAPKDAPVRFEMREHPADTGGLGHTRAVRGHCHHISVVFSAS